MAQFKGEKVNLVFQTVEGPRTRKRLAEQAVWLQDGP
jgi:hypothetical protein